MNYQKKNKIYMELKSMFKNPYPEGCIKWSNTSTTHFNTLCQVFDYLKRQGYEVYSECILNDGSRVDILAIKRHIGFLVEILHSETNKRFKDKLCGSYGDFTVIPVKTSNFNINTFKL